MSTKNYYETYWSPEGYFPTAGFVAEVQRIIEQTFDLGTDCLDVGCGDGATYGLWLNSVVGSYTGVDISENAVAHAREKGLNALRIDDASNLPFPDASFDGAICIEVMEHLFTPIEAAREIYRVLRPGGSLILSVPNVAYWRRRADLAVLGRWNPVGDSESVSKPWRDPHIRFFTPEITRRMLQEAGFSNVTVGGHGGGMMRDVPIMPRAIRNRNPSPAYKWLEKRMPAILGSRVHAIAYKP